MQDQCDITLQIQKKLGVPFIRLTTAHSPRHLAIVAAADLNNSWAEARQRNAVDLSGRSFFSILVCAGVRSARSSVSAGQQK